MKIVFALCGLFLAMHCLAGEAYPELMSLTIHNRHVTGMNFESANAPVVKTKLVKDTLEVNIRTKFLGQGIIDFLIPEQASKIKLFGIDFDVPADDDTARYMSNLIYQKTFPWYIPFPCINEREAILVSISSDMKSICVQGVFYTQKGNKIEIKNRYKRNSSITEDGQIIGYFDIDDIQIKSWALEAKPYYVNDYIINKNGELSIGFSGGIDVPIKYQPIMISNSRKIPQYNPQLLTVFHMNKPYMEKYLAEFIVNNPEVVCNKLMTLEEFKALCENIERLQTGMTVTEVEAILGKPDESNVGGKTNPELHELYRTDFYYVLRKSSDYSKENVCIIITFKTDENNIFRLQSIK